MTNHLNINNKPLLRNPWETFDTSDFLFPIKTYCQFVEKNFSNPKEWKYKWLNYINDYPDFLSNLLALDIDWVWGFYLPFLSEIEKSILINKKPIIIGLTGLPGTGKSTSASVISNLASVLGYSTFVLSLDDFYLPSLKMDPIMKGNPWNVSRGYPGSHSIEEISKCLSSFLSTGLINAPKFDKSLRDGKGDRIGWQSSQADVLILEGWFLGVTPIDSVDLEYVRNEPRLSPPLNKDEIEFRSMIQNSLLSYIPIWRLMKNIWHIKPLEFSFTSKWKKEQEYNLFKEKGASLNGDKLNSFIRMIYSSIPQDSLLNPSSDTIILLDENRRLNWVGISSKYSSNRLEISH